MDISKRTLRGLRDLGLTLPDQTSIEICMLDSGGHRVCHRFSVVKGVVSHHESHSADFVRSGAGPLSEK